MHPPAKAAAAAISFISDNKIRTKSWFSETILLLGGEVDSILHPATDTINTYGACGVFQSDLPPLSKPRREFSATLLGDDLVICGGMQLLSPPDKVRSSGNLHKNNFNQVK